MIYDDAETRSLVRRAVDRATPAPAPGFERRTLSALSGPRVGPEGRRTRRPIALLAALAAVVVAATAMAYPPARAAVAQLPGLGALGSLYGAPAQRPATLAEATSSGYTIRVTAGSDDGTTVVLSFAVTPANRQAPRYEIGWAGMPTATDSTGRELDSSFTPVRSALSSSVAFSRPPDGAPAGTPITVHVAGINLLGGSFPGQDRTISGPWTLRVGIKPSSLTHPLPAPAEGPLDGGTVTFDAVRANSAYISIRYTLSNVTAPPGTPAGKGFSPMLVVYGPDGRKLTMLSWGPVGNSETTFTWKGQLGGRPGTCRIVFTDSGGSTLLERTVSV
jgi:hypothetical protein